MLIGTAFFSLAFYLPFLFPEYTLLICCLCVAVPIAIIALSLSIVEKKYKKRINKEK